MYLPTKPWDLVSRYRGIPMIFVHTPKCGGRYVNGCFERRRRKCVTLREPDLRGHLTWSEYREGLSRLGKDISDYTTFGLVRNPWAWHLSWYNYIKKDRDGSRSGMADEAALFKTFSFRDYLHWIEDPTPTNTAQRYYLRQVSDWVLDDKGQIAVDTVLRQEQLHQDMLALREKYGLLIRIPDRRVNVSTKGDFRDAYTSEDVDLIAKRHKRDIDLFGYTFE